MVFPVVLGEVLGFGLASNRLAVCVGVGAVLRLVLIGYGGNILGLGWCAIFLS